ncbi:MAG: hypothetical protein Ta2E_11800 [Mycoplasmoidaceae bacterium]|nr:MAG: hypothetical protein Ta2E_11800 [Mycoplasmoidaceae bacterium]
MIKDTLTEWKNKHMGVDRAIAIWVHVQYHWTHLRPIFIWRKIFESNFKKFTNNTLISNILWAKISVDETSRAGSYSKNGVFL